MKHYIGIDLGTTNSAICSYDGQNVRVWKSPDQNDVTPSAIFVDKRGNRYYGRRAYEMAPTNEENSATLFKRYMGTSTKFNLKAANLSLTPEECSAEILKVLYGYLPEEIRNNSDTATVITVPAAFNQTKKDATLEAARLAGFSNVALMQEPVAAIMSVMRVSKQEGIFLIYDLGGGTFDVSIAENIEGKVNLLTQGGKEMCGGRDWDRLIFNNLVVPWLRKNFKLPDDFLTNSQYKLLRRMALYASEQAKIELSSRNEATIRADESTLHSMDAEGNEMYIDISIARNDLDKLITDVIEDTIQVTRETLAKAGLTAGDIEKIVFVGGPTNYKPLRDKVSGELALSANIDVNPMTSVAEGASIFAESIDWSDMKHNRKASNAEIVTGMNITFRYTARTSETKARVAFLTDKDVAFSVEITSTDSGWSSGRANLKNGMTLDLPLSKDGENTFDVVVYDSYGHAMPLKESRIIITKTMATIGAIPASHSIGVKVLDKLGGTPILDYLVEKDDFLPKKGQKVFKAGQTLKAGSHDALTFSLWEGDIQKPIEDNRYIGTYEIPGTSFEDGIIPTGAEIICEYEMSDSGAIHLGVSIPCVGADFGNRNFYARQDIDLSDTDRIADSGQKMLERIEEMAEKVDDPKLEKAREKATKAASINSQAYDQEDTQEASNELLEAKKLVAQARKEHIKEIRQIDLDSCANFFNERVRQYAKPSEADAFDNLTKAAQRSIDRNDPDFENQLSELKGKNFDILWRQDWFVVDWFNMMIQNPYNFSDRTRFESLKRAGLSFKVNDQIDDLRAIVAELSRIQITDTIGEKMYDNTTIIKG